MNKKYHYLYQVMHKESGRIYIGIHSTDNLNDRYFACGVYEASEKSDAEWVKTNHEFENPNHIVNALQKYGRNAFEREILEFKDTREEIILCTGAKSDKRCHTIEKIHLYLTETTW